MVSANEQWDIVTSVGLTALGVAAARAVETGRDGALVRDPFAETFVRAANPPRPMPTSPRDPAAATGHWPWMTDLLAVRSLHFDEYLVEAGRSGIRQVVLLAAGLDSRSFRLDWPEGSRVFEVDQPNVLEFKDQVLAEQGVKPGCERYVVEADLREDWTGALLAAGFDPSMPAAWLVEGLTQYLPAAAERQLFAGIDRLSAPGSRIGAEWVWEVAAMLANPEFRGFSDMLGIDLAGIWNTEPRTPAGDRLTGLGWETRTSTLAEFGAGRGRPFDGVVTGVLGRHIRLGTARR